MALVRWDPFNDLRNITQRMERALEPLGMPFHPERGVPLGGLGTTPTVDIYEDKEELVFRAEVPGLEQKEVEVLIEDSTLTIRGERKLMKEEKKQNYQRIESSYGAFSRSFTLPATIDRDKVRADLRNGLLEVHVPKREGAKGKAIPINA